MKSIDLSLTPLVKHEFQKSIKRQYTPPSRYDSRAVTKKVAHRKPIDRKKHRATASPVTTVVHFASVYALQRDAKLKG